MHVAVYAFMHPTSGMPYEAMDNYIPLASIAWCVPHYTSTTSWCYRPNWWQAGRLINCKRFEFSADS